MNKIFYAALVMATAVSFSSCVNEEDDIFDQSAAERLNAASALYSERLGASPNGWAMQLYPTTENEAPFGNGYLLLCDFDPDQSVKVAMNNELSNNQYVEDRSAWEVITDNGPVLTFNTYNSVMHTFSNPEDVSITTGTSEDETGTGIGGDYEFIIVDAPEDASYMMLKGKKRGTYNLLTPLEEGVDYEEYLEDVKDFQNTMFPTNAPTFDVLHFGDELYKMEDANDGIPNIYPYDGDAVIDESFNPFLITRRGDQYYLRFRDAISSTDEYTIQDFQYNTETDQFECVDNPEYYISGDSPLRFFNQALTEDGNNWRWTRTSDKSDDMKTLLDDIYNSLRTLRGSLRYVQFASGTDGKLNLGISYTLSGQGATANFVFSYTVGEEGLSLQYEEPLTNSANNLLTAIPEVGTLLTALSQEFVFSPATTAFDLNKIKVSSSSNSDMWFIVTLY